VRHTISDDTVQSMSWEELKHPPFGLVLMIIEFTDFGSVE